MTSRQHSPRVQAIWKPSEDPTQPTCTTTTEQLLAQLAWIDARIQRSQRHAATSNRARGAVREWTQKREALMREATRRGLQTQLQPGG